MLRTYTLCVDIRLRLNLFAFTGRSYGAYNTGESNMSINSSLLTELGVQEITMQLTG